MSESQQLAGRVAVVTGGAGGLGAATAAAYAGAGAVVVVADVDADGLTRTCERIREAGGTVDGIDTDVSDPAQVQAAVDRAVSLHGRLDIMVNNAAVIRARRLLDVTPDEWRTTLAVNAAGTLYGMQSAVRQMITQVDHGRPPGAVTGRIINVTSGGADSSSEMFAVYGASKAAVDRLTRGAATAFHETYGICVCAVRPVGMATPMWDDIDRQAQDAGDGSGIDTSHDRAEVHVWGRMQDPAEAADVLLWVADAPPTAINGRVITTAATIL